jgi:hypothetical protein
MMALLSLPKQTSRQWINLDTTVSFHTPSNPRYINRRTIRHYMAVPDSDTKQIHHKLLLLLTTIPWQAGPPHHDMVHPQVAEGR